MDVTVFSNDWDTPTKEAFLLRSWYTEPIAVDDIPGMVKQLIVLRECKRQLIRTLVIIGHGDPGYQAVGKGGASTICEDQWSTWEGELAKLRDCFDPHGCVILGGCHVGREPKIQCKLSVLWNNIPVIAFTDLQSPVIPGWEGEQVTAVGWHVHKGRAGTFGIRNPVDAWDEWEAPKVNVHPNHAQVMP